MRTSQTRFPPATPRLRSGLRLIGYASLWLVSGTGFPAGHDHSLRGLYILDLGHVSIFSLRQHDHRGRRQSAHNP
jgi:hypothetical protein